MISGASWSRTSRTFCAETDKVLPTGNAAAATAPFAGRRGTGRSRRGRWEPLQGPPLLQRRTSRSAKRRRSSRTPSPGVITIRATSRQHEKIQEFLDQVLVSARRQVLIEATIVEVRLGNIYQQGIDWSLLSSTTAAGATVPFLSAAPIGSPAGTPTQSLFTMNLSSASWNFFATIKLLETFGNVRVLSSPRISALNNQTAVLRVVDKRSTSPSRRTPPRARRPRSRPSPPRRTWCRSGSS